MSSSEQSQPMIGAPALKRSSMSRFGLGNRDIGCLIHTDNVCQGILLAPAFRFVNQDDVVAPSLFDVFTTESDTRFLTEDRKGELAACRDDMQRIAGLDVYGHKGVFLGDDGSIFQAAIDSPKTLAGWHMPGMELVTGVYAHRLGVREGDSLPEVTQPDNFLAHLDKGRLKGSFDFHGGFIRRKNGGGGFANTYSTSTRYEESDHVFFTVSMENIDGIKVGFESIGHCDADLGSSRPVRCVLRPA